LPETAGRSACDGLPDRVPAGGDPAAGTPPISRVVGSSPRTTRARQEVETTTVRQPRALQRHRIIERPRLFALLDESSARVRTLVAPAGYGKTTLAEQWVARDGRRTAWFKARRASTDVAALALGIARVLTILVPDCDVRIREHLRAVPSSADNSELLAEILGEDLLVWPDDGWLVIDDYHEIARGVEAEHFVASLLASTPVQTLIASRQRPSWVTTRGILYGEVLEVNQTSLAMDTAEAAEVLADQALRSAPGLVAVANGWPAVIGLASVSGAEIHQDVEQVPESLYRFFAEEVYSALEVDVRAGLATLAIAPVLDRELAVKLLGQRLAEATCAAGLDVGVIAERGIQLELHPLCRSFLEERGAQLGIVRDDDAVMVCIEHYDEHRDWDAAFELISKHGPFERLQTLLAEALDELLESARLSTVNAWCDLASQAKLEHPIFLLARAEAALRRGRHAEAQARAEAAAEQESELTFRALCVAGRAAHLASREEEGLSLYERAEAVASSEVERRDALWGQLMCELELELPQAHDSYRALRAEVKSSDPREIVRAATYGMAYGLKVGTLDLTEGDRAFELLDATLDGLVISSFQSIYSQALGLSARYAESLQVADEFLATANEYRLDFATPYALSSKALASTGLREWGQARTALDEAMLIAAQMRDGHAYQTAFTLLMRCLAQQGLFEAALALEMPSLRNALRASRGEVIASRALVLAAAGRADEALSTVEDVRGTSSAIEPRMLIAAVDAVCAMKARHAHVLEKTLELERAAFETGAVDLLVTAYRSAPDLLGLLLRVSPKRDRLAALVRRVGDGDLAAVVGQSVAVATSPVTRLTPREREVYELLLRGVSTKEIAQVLFISPATVKLHAHRIYEKFGLRSRTALLAQAALARTDHATSAIGGDSSEES
jgi:ATP/maltotriose-dependent transcriptional regulator MalT